MATDPSPRNATRNATDAARKLKKQIEKTRLECVRAIVAHLQGKSGSVDLPTSLCEALQTLYLASDPLTAPSLSRFVAQLQHLPVFYTFELPDGRYVRFGGGVNISTEKVELIAIISP